MRAQAPALNQRIRSLRAGPAPPARVVGVPRSA